jgi:hypothetical protein
MIRGSRTTHHSNRARPQNIALSSSVCHKHNLEPHPKQFSTESETWGCGFVSKLKNFSLTCHALPFSFGFLPKRGVRFRFETETCRSDMSCTSISRSVFFPKGGCGFVSKLKHVSLTCRAPPFLVRFSSIRGCGFVSKPKHVSLTCRAPPFLVQFFQKGRLTKSKSTQHTHTHTHTHTQKFSA